MNAPVSMIPPENALSTVVTAGDRAFAWGAFLLVASMRRNGMGQPVVVGAMDWPEDAKRRLLALGNVTIRPIPSTRQCLACQKPMLMACDDVKTPWVCWADADGIFVGDCSEWLAGGAEDELVIRRYAPAPPDFTPANLETWRRDVERHCGRALPESRLSTRVNTAFLVAHRALRPFMARWQRQIEGVLPGDVGIIMEHGTAYFQTDESVLASLLCFDPDAPAVAGDYKANGSADPSRYYAHFAYNPKPWRMWTRHASRWRDEVSALVDWTVENGFAAPRELPLPLRRAWWPSWKALRPAAPWVWRAMKLSRRLQKRFSRG